MNCCSKSDTIDYIYENDCIKVFADW